MPAFRLSMRFACTGYAQALALLLRSARRETSPNQVLTHAARAAAEQPPLVAATSGGRARRARRALVRARGKRRKEPRSAKCSPATCDVHVQAKIEFKCFHCSLCVQS